MVDISAIAGLANSLKVAGDLTKAVIDLRDAQMVQSKIIELQGVILSAQSSAMAAQGEHFALVERLRELEVEITRFSTWETERQRYELETLPPGIHMYRLKRGMENGEPPHKICATCYNQGFKSLLHITGQGNGLTSWKCHRCGFDEHSGTFIQPRVNT